MITDKIKSPNELQHICQSLKNSGKVIVFTNGCFDILHSGHVRYLEEAKACGDVLILGINSDASVKRLKGDSRPINSLEDRSIVLAALQSVDYVTAFHEDTPQNLIKQIVPHILVKGGDWKPESIVGSDIVLANGGEVRSLSFINGKSSTGIIEALNSNGKEL